MAPTEDSTRNTSTASYAWETFNPYGDETDISGNGNNTSQSAALSSDGWPLDEIINDIEQQMDQQNDAIIGMTSQMEDIEVSLSAARTRQAKKKKSSSSSLRSSLSFNNTRSYSSMEDYEEDLIDTDVDNRLTRSNRSNRSNDNGNGNDISAPRRHSILEILQRKSEFKREHSDGDFATSNVNRDLVPPSQLQNPRRSMGKTQSSSSSPSPSPSRVEYSPNALFEFPPSPRASVSNPKLFRSSLTWDESVSSRPSSSSEDSISALGETTFYSGKSTPIFESRKLKYVLAILAAVLVLLIGILTGQWVQQQQLRNNIESSASLSQQVQPPAAAPVASPAIAETVPTKPSSVGAEDEQDESKEETVDTGSTEKTDSEQSIGSTGDRQASPTSPPLQDPTISPKADPIEESSAANAVVVEEQTPNNNDSSTSNYDYTANTDFLVGVYYYPWHGERFHNGGGYMRKELEPPHVPTLGEYNDSDPQVIGHHMKWFRQANIGLLVTSWWGPNRLEDSNTKDVIMEHEDAGNLKIALHYETTSRLGSGTEKLPNAKTDIKYMCENYFDHPNYYKIDGRPVLFIYISRKLHFVGTLEEALLTMRSTASKCGHNLYLIGDSVFESAPDPNEPHVPFWYFDAVTNYDVYGSAGRPEGHVGPDRVDNYYRQQNEWKEQASRDECRYIPAVSPGYNDRGVRMEADHSPLSRRITSDSKEGSLFHYQLKQAKELVDPKIDNMILVNSFNEWHEDTQIEPVEGTPSSEPYNFTKGLEYEGYGELYLDILGAATSRDERRHSSFDYLFSGR